MQSLSHNVTKNRIGNVAITSGCNTAKLHEENVAACRCVKKSCHKTDLGNVGVGNLFPSCIIWFNMRDRSEDVFLIAEDSKRHSVECRVPAQR